MVNLTTANISDSAGAQHVLDTVHKRWPGVKHLFADSAYNRRQLLEKPAFLDFTVGIVRRTEAAFVVLPRRWVVRADIRMDAPATGGSFETIKPVWTSRTP